MHGRHLQELLNRRLLPGCQGVMELHHVFQDGRLGEYLTDQRLDGLLYALERDHLHRAENGVYRPASATGRMFKMPSGAPGEGSVCR